MLKDKEIKVFGALKLQRREMSMNTNLNLSRELSETLTPLGQGSYLSSSFLYH